jgi:hypothetical protein
MVLTPLTKNHLYLLNVVVVVVVIIISILFNAGGRPRSSHPEASRRAWRGAGLGSIYTYNIHSILNVTYPAIRVRRHGA